MFEISIVIGLVILTLACRTYDHPAIRRLAGVFLLAASFMAAYFLGGRNIYIGCVGILFWFLLPWVEILTRIRTMRLPVERDLDYRRAPNTHQFPELPDITHAIENEGFEQVEDLGWSWDGMEQFIRILHREEDRLQAAIFFTEQEGMAFAHTALITRTDAGDHLLSWNYPFSYTMKLPPRMRLNRVASGEFDSLLQSHLAFVDEAGIDLGNRTLSDGDELTKNMRDDMRLQLAHNRSEGILRYADSDEATVRYTVKGFFFLWFQIIKDMLRLG